MASWSTTTVYGTLSASGSMGQKNSSGDATFSGTISFSASSSYTSNILYITNARISIYYNGSYFRAQASGITVTNGSGSASVSVTIPFGSATSSSTCTGYGVLYDGIRNTSTGGSSSGSSSGDGVTLTASAYIDPTPAFTKKTISVSPTTVTMGNAVTISETAGVGVTSTSRAWTAGDTSGSFSTGSWTVPIATFEPLCPNASSLSIKFTVSSSGAGGSGSSSATITANVPSDYLPTADYTYEYLNAQNNSLVAGYSQLKLTLNPYLTPDDNHATISSVSLVNVISTNTAITTSSFTRNGYVFTSGTLPTMANVPSYTVALVFNITDSRGNTVQYTTEAFRVTNFIPPYCEITSLTRDTATTATLSVYISTPSNPALATVKVGNNTAVDVLSQLVQSTQDTTIYTLTYSITGLSSGDQYNVVFSFRNDDMVSYGESAYSYSQLLSTMAMPISLYDNGTRMAVSFGEECADNYGEDMVINFAKDSYIRYVRNNTAYVEKTEDVFYSCPFPVGGIYMSTDSSNPSTIWSGTTWQAIAQGRVLIGVGTGTDVP